MDITQYSLRRPKVIAFVLAVTVLGGIASFYTLGKKEDSPFVIKTAVVVTRYEGASPEQVEQLVTEPLESALQTLPSVKKITSESHYGYSRIMVELRSDTPARRIPQMWDELRRKTLDAQSALPKGASPIQVSDDFGDVFGIYYGLSADEGITYEELRDAARLIRREINSLRGVAKVTLFGEQQPVVNIFISRAKLAALSVRPENIISTINSANEIVSAGEKSAGEIQIKVVENSSYTSLDDIGAQLLTATDGRQVRLSDVARIVQDYAEPPQTLMRVNGRRAIGIGISTESGGDVVRTGEAVSRRLDEIRNSIPLGIELSVLYPEDTIARQANNTFIVNLLESVAIVILIIMLAIGFRAGVTIGTSLVFAIGGTLLLMGPLGEGLNRTSLAGFIIAMGMLVDNAIVVTDNAMKLMRVGRSASEAVVEGARQSRWGLLGATAIAVISFLPLYLARSSVSEIIRPLFVVLAVSLGLSWLLALTQVPLMGSRLLRPEKERFGAGVRLKKLIGVSVRYKWITVISAYFLLAVSLVVMSVLPKDFFPNLDKPYFRADCRLPDGYDIRRTEQTSLRIEKWLTAQPEVRTVSVTMGATPPRYYLATSAVSGTPGYANLLVEVRSKRQTESVMLRLTKYVRDSFPDVWIHPTLFKLSPAPEASIEFGFTGENTDTLVALTTRALAIMRSDARAVNVRNGWGNKVPVWTPHYSQVRGARLGVSRTDMARYMTVATTGYALGQYQMGDRFAPILMKDSRQRNSNLADMRNIPVFSRGGNVYPLEQTVSQFTLDYHFPVIDRYNRERVMKAQCDACEGVNTSELFTSLQERITDEIQLPVGYSMHVFGEAEGSAESNAALGEQLPLTLILIFVVLLVLFGDYRRPFIILLTVPLIYVGLVLGLLVTGKSFDFFSLLGLLGLVGMNIKNAVVLVDCIGSNPTFESVVDATASRVLPVTLASGTTILGMLPLAFDAMFGSMAVGIMGGLLVATLLTVFVLPAVFALLMGVKPSEK